MWRSTFRRNIYAECDVMRCYNYCPYSIFPFHVNDIVQSRSGCSTTILHFLLHLDCCSFNFWEAFSAYAIISHNISSQLFIVNSWASLPLLPQMKHKGDFNLGSNGTSGSTSQTVSSVKLVVSARSQWLLLEGDSIRLNHLKLSRCCVLHAQYSKPLQSTLTLDRVKYHFFSE